tara:strand:- start:741 stop:935 length:195 start_codon:yes stop_codon:yes gene_type:complete
MAYSTLLTVSEAKVGIDQQMFPPDSLKEGDYVWYPGGSLGTDMGHRFRWDGTQWVSDPAELPVV